MGIEIFARVKDGSLPRVTKTEHNCNIKFTYQKNKYNYNINKIWNNNEGNKEIYDYLKRNEENYSNFYFAAFGYTGSGKTYTIFNILKLFIDELIEKKKQKNEKENVILKKYNVITISAYQIYCEKMYDMLNNNKQLKIFKTNKLVINNLTTKNIENRESIIKLIEKNRKMASTNMNEVSSRSHAIITICYSGNKYTFIDMAGQESGVTSCHNEQNIKKQGTAINLNMLALKECIRLHHIKQKHIPFRRTLLTLALKPLFTNHCYVAFICTICAKQKLFYQLDSIRYASALYNEDNLKKDVKMRELFKKYTDYVEESGWLICKERDLWIKMRNGNMNEFSNVFGYMKKRLNIILGLSKISVKYKKILPTIPNLNMKKIAQAEKKYIKKNMKRNIKQLKPIKEVNENFDTNKVNRKIVNNKMVNRKIINNRMVNNKIVNNKMVNNRMVNNRIMNRKIMNNRIMNRKIMNRKMVNKKIANNKLVNNVKIYKKKPPIII